MRGRFTEVPADRRTQPLADADRHDTLLAEFTRAGTLTCDRTLTAFSVRCVVRTEAEADAVAKAETLASSLVAGTIYELRRTSATCMEDIKIRRRR